MIPYRIHLFYLFYIYYNTIFYFVNLVYTFITFFICVSGISWQFHIF